MKFFLALTLACASSVVTAADINFSFSFSSKSFESRVGNKHIKYQRCNKSCAEREIRELHEFSGTSEEVPSEALCLYAVKGVKFSSSTTMDECMKIEKTFERPSPRSTRPKASNQDELTEDDILDEEDAFSAAERRFKEAEKRFEEAQRRFQEKSDNFNKKFDKSD